LKEFAKEMINRGHRNFYVDVESCSMMDSTFMGTLAGIGLRLKELGHGEVVVFNANDRNEDLLRNLGLDHILTITKDRVLRFPKDEPSLEKLSDTSVNAETMLEAHEALVEASAENLDRFKDVLEYLRQDLQVPAPPR
jgi:hypothetical protein